MAIEDFLHKNEFNDLMDLLNIWRESISSDYHPSREFLEENYFSMVSLIFFKEEALLFFREMNQIFKNLNF